MCRSAHSAAALVAALAACGNRAPPGVPEGTFVVHFAIDPRLTPLSRIDVVRATFYRDAGFPMVEPMSMSGGTTISRNGAGDLVVEWRGVSSPDLAVGLRFRNARDETMSLEAGVWDAQRRLMAQADCSPMGRDLCHFTIPAGGAGELSLALVCGYPDCPGTRADGAVGGADGGRHDGGPRDAGSRARMDAGGGRRADAGGRTRMDAGGATRADAGTRTDAGTARGSSLHGEVVTGAGVVSGGRTVVRGRVGAIVAHGRSSSGRIVVESLIEASP